MTSANDVAQAILGRLNPLPALQGWEKDWFERAPFPKTPYLCIEFEKSKSGDFQRNMGTAAMWWPRVCLYYPFSEQETAYQIVGDLIDPDGVIVTALKARTPDDNFRRICGGDGYPNISPTTSRGPMPIRKPSGRYLYGSIGFEMGTR